MLKKISNILYAITRKIGKAASTAADLETLATLNPEKIIKRIIRKKINKAGYKATSKISRKIK